MELDSDPLNRNSYDPGTYSERVRQRISRLYAEADGDITSEQALAQAFSRVYLVGTQYVSLDKFRAQLTRKQLKLREKEANVAGLQICDMIAMPSMSHCRAMRMRDPMPKSFESDLTEILETSKYDRHSVNGSVRGYGRKWLPH